MDGVNLLEEVYLTQKKEQESLFGCHSDQNTHKATHGVSSSRLDSGFPGAEKNSRNSEAIWKTEPVSRTQKAEDDIPFLKEKASYYSELQRKFRQEALLKERICNIS